MNNLYFNNAFSKRPLAEVLERMIPCLREQFESPLTESEQADRVRQEILQSRESIALLLHARAEEIFFVSSGTEANNWALKGAAYAHEKNKKHLIISAIEHFSVYQTAQFLQRQGFEVTFVPVSPEGFVDPDVVAGAIRPATVLVSIQGASDEIGVIQNLDAIASLKQQFNDVLFHSDAVQYLCYEELPLQRIPLDLVSISSNALYGPAGIAALYIRAGTRIIPMFHGGMQEEGLRPGLQSTALIAGFGEAARINLDKKRTWKQQLASLQEKCFDAMDSLNIPVTGSRSCRLVDNIHVLADVDGEALLTLLLSEGIQASSGSTCYQYAHKESHVLKALEMNPEQVRGSMLFTLSKDHTPDDVQSLMDSFGKMLDHLRKVKPATS